MAKRKGLTKRIRFEIFKRDSFTCQYCGRKPPDAVLECDHIESVVDGGSDDPLNLITACFDCNRGKSDVPLELIPQSVSDQMVRQIEAAEQLQAFNQHMLGIRKQQEEMIDELGAYWLNFMLPPKKRNTLVLAQSSRATLRVFFERLPVTEIMEAMEIAHARLRPTHRNDAKAWQYFCGVSWRKIKGDDRHAAS